MRKIRIGDSCNDKRNVPMHHQLTDYQSSIDDICLLENSFNPGFMRTMSLWINVGTYQKERLCVRNQFIKPLYNVYRECRWFDEKTMHNSDNFAVVELSL